MSQYKTVIVLDVGATNVRAVAVDETGKIRAMKFFPNSTRPDPFYKDGLIWDVDEIWGKLIKAIKEVVSNPMVKNIVAVTLTTFGVDFAPVSNDGKLLYPVISWACKRTVPVMDSIDKYISLKDLYHISGVNKFGFNTINKLIWLKENHPEIIEKANHYAFISSILLYKLTGNFVTEMTMAGTSMLTDRETRAFSQDIFGKIGVENKFPLLVEAGEIVGNVNNEVSVETGIPYGVPVVAGGHDTQFAVFGSGAGINEPVLSSGTWEVLMVRTPEIKLDDRTLSEGVTTEFDALTGLFDSGVQWLGSGILEWVKRLFFADILNDENVYDRMISEAESVFDTDVRLLPEFLTGKGKIENLSINTERGEIYLAALRALTMKTKNALDLLQDSCGFEAQRLYVVGGGSKNRLWNKLRGDVLGIPVKTVRQKETTVLGAAMFAFTGTGIYDSADEARDVFKN